MWHLSEEYISGSFQKIDQRFDALERSLTQQMQQLESDNYTTIRQLEERINERLETILGLLHTGQDPPLLGEKSAISVSLNSSASKGDSPTSGIVKLAAVGDN